MSGVKLSERIYARVEKIWPRYLRHPFVTQMADGTLPPEKFRYYMLQDYLYLRDYVKIFAAIIQKADDFEQIRFLSGELANTIDETFRTHRPYMERLGITEEEIRRARPHIDSVLNLFAYTGGATIACAAAGASVCHVDAAKGMVLWAKENAKASGLEDRPIRWIVDDCAKFVEREIRRGKTYDAIIMDPPSYGRGPGGEIWKLEDNVYDLITLTEQVLSDDPLFFAINSYTEGLSPAVMEYIVKTTLCPVKGGHTHCDEIGLPVSATGGVVPCGATAIWEK